MEEQNSRFNALKLFIENFKLNLTVLKLAALGLGFCALCLSVYFSIHWFTYNGQVEFVSTLLSVIFIGFINFIFEVSLGSVLSAWNGFEKIPLLDPVQQKIGKVKLRLRFSFGVFGIFLALLMGIYSIFAIIGSQYNDLIEKQTNKEILQTVEIKVSSGSVQEKKQAAETKKADYKKELDILVSLKPPKDLEETAQYARTKAKNEARIDLLRDKIDSLDKEIANLIDQADKSKTEETQAKGLNHGTVYSYLHSVTGIDQLLLQFLGSALPSFFLDLISLISFAFVLYRKKI